MLHGPFGQIACLIAVKKALRNNSRSYLVDGSSIKQDKETELIPSMLTFLIKFWICFCILWFVNFLGWPKYYSLLNMILLITILHFKFPLLTSMQLPYARF